jgi:hypothetical protein
MGFGSENATCRRLQNSTCSFRLTQLTSILSDTAIHCSRDSEFYSHAQFRNSSKNHDTSVSRVFYCHIFGGNLAYNIMKLSWVMFLFVATHPRKTMKTGSHRCLRSQSRQITTTRSSVAVCCRSSGNRTATKTLWLRRKLAHRLENFHRLR